MTIPCKPKDNRLLGASPDSDLQVLSADLEAVDLTLGQVVYESGGAVTHVYFPTTAIVSLQTVKDSGSTAQVGVVGNEGVVGISMFMGAGNTPSRGIVQCAGRGIRLPSRRVREQFDCSGTLMHLFLRYTQALVAEMTQIAACSQHHPLEQQLCRWLLLGLDRFPGTNLVMTRELIADLLGVGREGVTEAALKLQRAGLVRHARGHFEVLDRRGLEERSCDCYKVLKLEFERLLPACKTAEVSHRHLHVVPAFPAQRPA